MIVYTILVLGVVDAFQILGVRFLDAGVVFTVGASFD